MIPLRYIILQFTDLLLSGHVLFLHLLYLSFVCGDVVVEEFDIVLVSGYLLLVLVDESTCS